MVRSEDHRARPRQVLAALDPDAAAHAQHRRDDRLDHPVEHRASVSLRSASQLGLRRIGETAVARSRRPARHAGGRSRGAPAGGRRAGRERRRRAMAGDAVASISRRALSTARPPPSSCATRRSGSRGFGRFAAARASGASRRSAVGRHQHRPSTLRPRRRTMTNGSHAHDAVLNSRSHHRRSERAERRS